MASSGALLRCSRICSQLGAISLGWSAAAAAQLRPLAEPSVPHLQIRSAAHTATAPEGQSTAQQNGKSRRQPQQKGKEVSEVEWLMKFASQTAHTFGYHNDPCPNGYAFHMPPTSLIGANSLPESGEVISRLGFKKALVVTDKFLSARGGAGYVINILSSNYIDYHLFDGISPNPTCAEVEEHSHVYGMQAPEASLGLQGLQALEEAGCDFILSFGGGSPHDAAKAISLLKTNGGNIRDYVGVNLAKRSGFPLVAVGTSGTGSEMTRFACITDEERMTKLSIIDSMMTPIVTVEDPAVLQMPRHLTAATGMDCLTHAIEAYFSTNSNPVTDATALHSIRLVSRYLKQAHATTNFTGLKEQKANSEARDMMGYASYLAGMSFNNAGLGLVHAMSHQIGGLYNLPHGVCCALLLPAVLRFNAAQRPDLIPDIALAMGIQGADSTEALDRIIAFIIDLGRNLGLPRNLEELGVEQEDFEFMASNALHDSCIVTNCRRPSKDEVVQLFAEAYAQEFEWR